MSEQSDSKTTSNHKVVTQSVKQQVQDFDWESWQPGMWSTIVFIVQEDQVLLIDKKTGLGKGKVNGPGGKVEGGESWLQCAQREVQEELGIEVGTLKWMAELRFLMSDYPDILCHVFFAIEYNGEPSESREARPFWCKINEVPYAKMWEDDQYWLPRALLGERVLGLFSFEGDQMLSLKVERHHEQDSASLPPQVYKA